LPWTDLFTGLIELLATVRSITAVQPGRLVVIEANWPNGDVAVGDSITVNGVCLTAVTCDRGLLTFQIGPETLLRTNLGELQPSDRVNLERALLPSTRMGGHFVQGHVDDVARIADRRHEGEWEWMDFIANRAITDQMVPKGSVAVDGVSLTLVHVSLGKFGVMLIPHTLANTTLGLKEVGAVVNVETDILSKYVFQAVRNLRSIP